MISQKFMFIIKYIFFLACAMLGNPFYQMISYIICLEFGFSIEESTNVYQANLFAFVGILILIFCIRGFIYARICTSKEHPFNTKGSNSFLYIFAQRHVYQCIGLLMFILWVSPLEGNIIGFFVFPLTLLSGTILSLTTFIRLLQTKKIFIEKNYYDQNIKSPHGTR